MAKALNQHRIRTTKIALILCFTAMIFCSPLAALDAGAPLNILLDTMGYFLVAVCALGRVYCTAFLGGHKNSQLITHGPFSACRNPLYFFSFVGACGIALMSNHLVLMLLIPALFYSVFIAVIKREESFLIDHFGTEYTAYCNTTPRLIPQWSRFNTPESTTLYPEFLLKGSKDAITWFIALPLTEIVEVLQHNEVITPLFLLP